MVRQRKVTTYYDPYYSDVNSVHFLQLKYEAEIVDLDGPLPEVCPDPSGGPFNVSGAAGVLLANGAPALCGGLRGSAGYPR